MTNLVRNLRSVEPEPSREVVELLERVLESARRGEILAVGVVAHHRGGAVGDVSFITRDGDGAHLIAGLERLKFRILKDNV